MAYKILMIIFGFFRDIIDDVNILLFSGKYQSSFNDLGFKAWDLLEFSVQGELNSISSCVMREQKEIEKN